MLTAGLSITAVAGAAILIIGVMYLIKPTMIATTFGLPALPSTDATAWLRVKGVRDAAAGVAAFVLLATAPPNTIAWVVVAFSLIPAGDALIVWFCGGSRVAALAIHGSTTVIMLTGAVTLWAA